jgi:hypothetical protein
MVLQSVNVGMICLIPCIYSSADCNSIATWWVNSLALTCVDCRKVRTLSGNTRKLGSQRVNNVSISIIHISFHVLICLHTSMLVFQQVMLASPNLFALQCTMICPSIEANKHPSHTMRKRCWAVTGEITITPTNYVWTEVWVDKCLWLHQYSCWLHCVRICSHRFVRVWCIVWCRWSSLAASSSLSIQDIWNRWNAVH